MNTETASIAKSTQKLYERREALNGITAFSAAHDGPELAIICFDPAKPENVMRRLL